MPPKLRKRNARHGPPGKPRRGKVAKKSNETKLRERKWTQQYYQGKDHSSFPGIGCGTCTFISPEIDFLSPFEGKGHLEIMTGVKEPLHACIRIHPQKDHPDDVLAFIVPFEHIEQIFIIPNGPTDYFIGEDTLRVVVVPTAATCTSSVRNIYSQIIQFKLPNRMIDDQTKGAARTRRKSQEKPVSYLNAFKTAFDQQLESFGKETILCSKEQKDIFTISTHISPIEGTSVTNSIEGKLYFVPTGILWFSSKILYFPLRSFSVINMIFNRDMASEKCSTPVVATGLLLALLEPSGDAEEEQDCTPEPVCFGDFNSNFSLGVHIGKFVEKHDLRLEKVEQVWYDFAKRELMTGFSPVDDDDL